MRSSDSLQNFDKLHAEHKADFSKELIENYEIIHKSIINYELDQNSIVKDPRGMFCNYLKVNFYKYAVKKNFIKTISTIFENLNIHIENLIPSPLSSALATLNNDDKLLGAICIDFGSESTSVSVAAVPAEFDGINRPGRSIRHPIAQRFLRDFRARVAIRSWK